jgi:hypothetical protein
MVYSLKLTFVANGNNPVNGGFTPVKPICFGSLEFTIDRFSNLSLSPKGEDSAAIFVGMVHSGSPSLHTILEESSHEGDAASGGEGSFRFLDPRWCNMVTPTVPIATTPPPKNTPTLLTILTTQLWTTTPQPAIGLLLE